MTISTAVARQRFTIIPTPLQDAIFAPETTDIVQGIAQQYHLDDIRNATLGKIVSWILLGFLHPEDASKEIQEQLTLSPQIAGEISKSLDVKIFDPLKNDLSKAYAPAPSSPETKGAPNMIQEVKAPTPGPQIISQTYTASPNLGATGFASNKNVAAQAPQPPQTSDDAGWSRRAPQGPTVKLGAITPQVPTPPPAAIKLTSVNTSGQTSAPMTQPAPKPPAPVAPQRPMSSISEFDRLDAAKKMGATTPPTATIPTPTPPAPPKPQGPAPMILHQQAAMPTQNTPDFKLNAPVRDQMVGKPSAQATPSSKPVVLEFGSDPSAPAPKAVHYTDYQPPAPPRPATSNAPRQVTEVTAPQTVPMPPLPPKPPSPPSPSSQQQPPQPSLTQGKVIVKDFL